MGVRVDGRWGKRTGSAASTFGRTRAFDAKTTEPAKKRMVTGSAREPPQLARWSVGRSRATGTVPTSTPSSSRRAARTPSSSATARGTSTVRPSWVDKVTTSSVAPDGMTHTRVQRTPRAARERGGRRYVSGPAPAKTFSDAEFKDEAERVTACSHGRPLHGIQRGGRESVNPRPQSASSPGLCVRRAAARGHHDVAGSGTLNSKLSPLSHCRCHPHRTRRRHHRRGHHCRVRKRRFHRRPSPPLREPQRPNETPVPPRPRYAPGCWRARPKRRPSPTSRGRSARRGAPDQRTPCPDRPRAA